MDQNKVFYHELTETGKKTQQGLTFHFRTSRNLHSHQHEAPLTRKHFQVTGYGIVSEWQSKTKAPLGENSYHSKGVHSCFFNLLAKVIDVHLLHWRKN